MNVIELLNGLTALLDVNYTSRQSYDPENFDLDVVYIEGPLAGSMHSRISGQSHHLTILQFIVNKTSKSDVIITQAAVNSAIETWEAPSSLVCRNTNTSDTVMKLKHKNINSKYYVGSITFEFEYYEEI